MTIQINGTSGISGVDGSAATPALQGTDSNTGISFGTDQVNINTGGTTAVTVDSSQRVGIGTTSVDELLHVEGAASGGTIAAKIQNNVGAADSDAALKLTTNSDTWQITSKYTGGALAISSAGGERARIESDGDVLLGAGSNYAYIRGYAPTTGDMTIGADQGATGTGGSNLIFRSRGGEKVRIASSGILYSAPTYNNTTADAANMFVSASGQFYRSTSSLKYKTDIETLQDSYADAILNVRPVWYRSTCNDDCPEHSYWGFIAEEVAQIDKRLVQWKTTEITYDENGSAVETSCDPEPDGVAYERFVPHLLNLIKRQKEAIEALETRVAQLEGGTN